MHSDERTQGFSLSELYIMFQKLFQLARLQVIVIRVVQNALGLVLPTVS